MTGLIAIICFGVLLAIAFGVYSRIYRFARRKGSSTTAAFGWGVIVVVLISFPFTWDAIPTWIAFHYYAKKEAGITVFKTLEKWKTENPGVAETLAPFGPSDKRANFIKLTAIKTRNPINDRFAYDSTSREPLFLTVRANRDEIVDIKTGEVLVRYVEIVSGNSGGFASGGEGWWAFWLIHKSTEQGFDAFFKFLRSVKNMGVKNEQ